MLGMLGLRETGRRAGAAPPAQGPTGSSTTMAVAASSGDRSKSSSAMESSRGNGKVFPGSPQDISRYAAGDGGTNYNRKGGRSTSATPPRKRNTTHRQAARRRRTREIQMVQ